MATFNITKRAFARERIRFTNGGVLTLTATLYNDNAGSSDAAKKKRASAAVIVLDISAGDIHFSEEGTAPTTAVDNTGVGKCAGARDQIILESYESIVKFKAIALTATNADAEIVYYR
jgi:hypothetical protein